ncbi:MAG: MoaD/ThiS family protein [Campylobacterales bacterium]|nr:MoaD/ThiS family protein [Campylobacterales bacterium]
MITIEFLGPIAQESITIEASSLRDVAKFLQQDSKLSSWLDSLAIAINDKLTDNLDAPLNDGDRVSLLPPVCGG